MNNIKILAALVLGGIIGTVGGGYIGYEIGSSDTRVDSAPGAELVEVTEVKRPSSPIAAEPAAEVAPEETATEPVAATPAGQNATEKYAITPNDESELMWTGYKTVLGQRLSMAGGFANFEGTVTVVNNSPDESYVDVSVDINSLFSESGILTGVLKGDEFFDVANYPEAKFESTKIEVAGDGYTITGNFTMHGATQGIQFPAKIERQGDNVYIEAEFKINRKQWNIGYDSFKDALILEDVVVSLKMLAEEQDLDDWLRTTIIKPSQQQII